jgi:drug/metabolite transporter (DMT)-like permease
MTGATRAHAALSAVALIYGANYVIAKSVMPDPIGPNSFIVLRVFGAAVLFWLMVNRRIQWPARRDVPRLVACALTGVVINQLFFFNGLALTSPLNSAIIMTSNPILVMVISAWLFKQKVTPRRIAGVVLGAMGAVSLLMLSSFASSQLSSTAGDVAILVNSVSYAFYLVLVKPLMVRYKPLTIVTWVFTIGFFCVLPFGGWGLGEVKWSVLTSWQWFCVVFVIVCVTFFTYLLNILALSHVPPTVASSYIYFQPLLAALFSWLFTFVLDSDYTGDFSLAKAGCALMIFLGVYMVGKDARGKKPLPT